jgi:hypothetical protein
MSPAAHGLRARVTSRSVHVGPLAKYLAGRVSHRLVPHRGCARDRRAGRRLRVGRDGRVVGLGGLLHELDNRRSVVDTRTEDLAAAAGDVMRTESQREFTMLRWRRGPCGRAGVGLRGPREKESFGEAFPAARILGSTTLSLSRACGLTRGFLARAQSVSGARSPPWPGSHAERSERAGVGDPGLPCRAPCVELPISGLTARKDGRRDAAAHSAEVAPTR